MPRVLTGNKYKIPGGLEPMEWANRVFAYEDLGYSQEDAKAEVLRDIEWEDRAYDDDSLTRDA